VQYGKKINISESLTDLTSVSNCTTDFGVSFGGLSSYNIENGENYSRKFDVSLYWSSGENR